MDLRCRNVYVSMILFPGVGAMHIRFIAFLLPILLTVASPVAADTITVTLSGTGAGPGGGGRGMVGQRNNAITLVAAGGLLLVFDAGRSVALIR